MGIVRNRHRSLLRGLPPPPAWESKQAERLVCAILAAPTCLVDLYTEPDRVVTSVLVSDIGASVPPDSAEHEVERGLAHAEQEITRLRGVLRAYGSSVFAPEGLVAAEDAPRGDPGDTQETYMRRWLDAIHARGHHVWSAGGARFARTRTTGYQPVPATPLAALKIPA